MKTITTKTEIMLNINDEYRIETNGMKHEYKQFASRIEFVKFINANFNKTSNRWRQGKTAKLYADWKDSIAYIVITSGQYAGSFACIKPLGAFMSRFDKSEGKWTMTLGNKGNDVSGHSHYDQMRWTVNKPYEKFTKKVAEGKVNHFKSAMKLTGDNSKQQLANLLATMSDEEVEEILSLRKQAIERMETKANVEPKKTKKEVESTVVNSEVDALLQELDGTANQENDKEEEMIVFMEEIKQEDPQLDSELLEVALESAPKVQFERPAVSTFLEDEDMDFYEPKPAIKLVNSAFEEYELAKYSKDKWLVEQKENGFDAFEQEANDEYAAMVSAREEANSSWNYLNHSDNRYGSASYY